MGKDDTIPKAFAMEISDGGAALSGGIIAVFGAIAGWLYSRIGKVHARIDNVVNHMTAEDNKLHARIDHVNERLGQILVLDERLQSIQAVQHKMADTLDAFASTSRHKMNNIEQVMVRMDERLKHVEGDK